jgi:hypothetical protein
VPFLTEQFLGISVLQGLADPVLLLLDRELVVAFQLDFTHSTALRGTRLGSMTVCDAERTRHLQVGSSQIERQEGTAGQR